MEPFGATFTLHHIIKLQWGMMLPPFTMIKNITLPNVCKKNNVGKDLAFPSLGGSGV
jgi:hypothetical protein